MMRPSGLWRLYRQRLRVRAPQELLAVAGIAFGVALVFAAIVASTSLNGSVQQINDGIVGDARLQLIARSPAGVDAQLLDDVDALPGVEQAAPLVEARATIAGPDGSRSVMLVGGDPRFARLGGALVHQFSAAELARQRAVALPEPLASGLGLGLYSSTTIHTGAGTLRLPLGAVLRTREIGSLIHSPIAIVPLTVAQDATGMGGRISRIYVRPTDGRDRQVREALQRIAGDRATVRPADFDADLFARASSPSNQSTLMFAALAALVGVFFAAAAVWLTVPQRRGLVAALGRAGYTPAAIAAVLLFDALMLGLAGGLVGLLLGDQLSRHLSSGVPGFLSAGWAIGDQRIVPWYAIAGAALVGMLAASAALLIALADTQHSADPRAAARRAAAAPIAGVVLAAGAAVLAAAAPQLALVGLIATGAAVLLLLPFAVRAATAVLARATRRLSPAAVWWLAVLELRSSATTARTIALTATGAIAVFAVVAISGARSDLVRGLDGSGRDVDGNADIWVTTRDATRTFAVTPFTLKPETLTALRRLSGVAAVGIYRGSFSDIGDRKVWIQAPPRDAPAPVPPGQLLNGDVDDATRQVRAGGALVVSQQLADAAGVGVGDRLTLPTARPSTYTVAAISNNLGWPSGALIMNADDYADSWQSDAPSALQIRTTGTVPAGTVAAAVRRTLPNADTLTVETRQQRIRLHERATAQGLERLNQIAVLVLVIAILAMAAATAGAIWQRRPAIARYHRLGFYTGQIWRALVLEAAVLLGTGCIVGAAAGLLGQRLLASALQTITGFPVTYTTALPIAAGAIAAVTATAVAIIAIPGAAAATRPQRRRPHAVPRY